VADDYCTAGDVYSFGLPRGAVPNPGRLAQSALASTNVITLDVHGFDADSPVVVRPDAGGSLPGGLSEGTTYYVIPVDESSFRLAATAGGAAIDLSSDGESVVVIAPLPMAEAITFASRLIDNMLPAHVVPLTTPYPPIVVMTAAELAGGKLCNFQGAESKSMADMVDAAQKRLERWGKGVPVRGTNRPTAASLSASAGTSCTDWDRHGGL
jgi:hypothetical protein